MILWHDARWVLLKIFVRHFLAVHRPMKQAYNRNDFNAILCYPHLDDASYVQLDGGVRPYKTIEICYTLEETQLYQISSKWRFTHHGLYYRALSMGEGDFRPSTARRPLDRFSWNLKYITTSQTRPRMQNFRGLCRRGLSGQISSLTHESFCPFFRFFATPTGRIFGHIPTLNTSLYVVSAKVVPFGG